MALTATLWLLALVRLLVDPTPRLPLLFNWTGSLPYHMAWMGTRPAAFQRGDHVVYRFAGPIVYRRPGLAGQPFFKQIAGLPGDMVTVQDRSVYVNGIFVGRARALDSGRRVLQPIVPLVVPAHHYYVRGTSDDSFDSRYRESGLVRDEQILAVVRPLL